MLYALLDIKTNSNKNFHTRHVHYGKQNVPERDLNNIRQCRGWIITYSQLWIMWSAVAQLVECRTRNRESPGSNPLCYRFEVWAFSFTSRRLSRLSCINEYLAIDSGGNVSE